MRIPRIILWYKVEICDTQSGVVHCLDSLPTSDEEAAILGHQVADSSSQRKEGTWHAQQPGSRDIGSLQQSGMQRQEPSHA